MAIICTGQPALASTPSKLEYLVRAKFYWQQLVYSDYEEYDGVPMHACITYHMGTKCLIHNSSSSVIFFSNTTKFMPLAMLLLRWFTTFNYDFALNGSAYVMNSEIVLHLDCIMSV